MKSKGIWFAATTAAALIAVPASLGTPPERIDATVGPSVVPAGIACPFAVRRTPENNSATFTVFGDGRVQLTARAQVTLTNLDTGASTLWESHFTDTFTPGMDGEADSFALTGRVVWVVFPGEPNPLGGVGPALLGVIGHVDYTIDADTGLATSVSLDGQAVDLCAVLAAT